MPASSSWLEWLARHPHIALMPVAALMLVALVSTIRVLPRASDDLAASRHDWSWGLLLFAILAAGRWPGWLAPMPFNADEGQLLAGAHALTRDPIFWRSVNGATAGPLDFFALWPAGWLCGWMSYLPARLTAAVLIAGALTLVHQSLTLVVGRGPARIASLAMIAFEALTDAPDLLHYSTELVPLFLQAGAFYAAVRRWKDGGSVWCAVGGFLLGAVPFAKLQAAPLAALVGLAWLGAELLDRDGPWLRRAAWLVSGALSPAIFFAGQLSFTHEWESFTASYWLSNLRYTTASPQDLAQTLRAIFDASLRWDASLHYWVPGVAIWLLLLIGFRARSTRADDLLLLAAALATAAALLCVLLPHRAFLHYWQLLVVPLGGLLGLLLGRASASPVNAQSRSGRWLVIACGCSLVGTLLVERALTPNRFVPGLAYYGAHPRGVLASRLLAHARPGESVAVWGWSNEAYAETGLFQATRDAHVQTLVTPGPLQEYFRRCYLADLLRARPELFVDSAGAGSLHYIPRGCAHDLNFPALAAVIRADYTLVEQFGDTRIYRRTDLLR